MSVMYLPTRSFVSRRLPHCLPFFIPWKINACQELSSEMSRGVLNCRACSHNKPRFFAFKCTFRPDQHIRINRMSASWKNLERNSQVFPFYLEQLINFMKSLYWDSKNFFENWVNFLTILLFYIASDRLVKLKINTVIRSHPRTHLDSDIAMSYIASKLIVNRC